MADADTSTNPTPGTVENAKSQGPTLEIDENQESGDIEDNASDTTSVASSIIRGHVENGRRYSSLRENYWGPSDEAQFETMDRCHFVYLIMRSEMENMLFQAPIKDPKRILDIGTGSGVWAMDVADKFPDAQVYGVDLYPPPQTWTPPNLSLEVEDVVKEWTWAEKFDLIHLRFMVGAFSNDEWAEVYSKAYDNLEPGGWIEQLEPDCRVLSDDGSLSDDSPLAKWGPMFIDCAKRAGRSIETVNEFRPAIEKAGFTNVQEDYFKVPVGTWVKNPRLKEAGRIRWHEFMGGLEGYALVLLTHFGQPKPWTKEEVYAYLAQVREQFRKPGQHMYQFTRRVWAQKPFDARA